jgi:pimeloyl-ACP methyl ester carboxylesterase
MMEMVFGPAPNPVPEQMRPLAELIETISRSTRPRVVSIPRLTDDQLRQLRMPILTIVGGRDVLLDSADTRSRLQQHAPHAEIDFIEEGYHFLPDQAPRIMEFLARHVQPGV